MSFKKCRKKEENNSILSNIIDEITSLSPELLLKSDSSPTYIIEKFKLDYSKKKRRKRI